MKKRIKYVCLTIVAMIFLVPYLGVVCYALPRNDEFASAAAIKKYGGYSLSAVFSAVSSMYKNWEGNYAGHFFWAAINPIVIGNSDSTVIAFNIISFVIFVVAWSYIIYNLVSLYKISKENKIGITLMVLIMSMNCRFLRELLAWFTGTVYYTWTFLAGILGLILLIKHNEKKPELNKESVAKIIQIGICSIVGVGGVLQIAVVLCWCYTLYGILSVIKKKAIHKTLICVMITYIAAMINLLSPGYYIRKNDYESISFVKAIIYAIVCVLKEIKRICTETYLPYALLLLLIILFYTIKTDKKEYYTNPIIVAGAWIIGMIGSVIPVCYGYGSPVIASRGYEILDLCIISGSVMFLCSMTVWLKSINVTVSRETVFTLSLVMIIFISTYSIGNIEISDIPSVKCAVGLADGSISDYSRYWRSKIHQVETSPKGGDLIIDVEGKYLDEECIIDRFQLQEDTSNWVNLAVSQYYGYDSVRIRRAD